MLVDGRDVELTILLVGIILPWTLIIGFGSGLWASRDLSPDLQFVVLGLLVAVWLVVGGSLLLPRRAGVTARDQSIG